MQDPADAAEEFVIDDGVEKNDILTRVTDNDHGRWILIERVALGVLWFLYVAFWGAVAAAVAYGGWRLYLVFA